MKKVCFMLAFSLATLVSVNAQHQGGHRGGQGAAQDEGTHKMPTAQEMADKETQRETKMLGLSADQINQAKAINLKYSQQRADLMAQVQQTKDRASMENQMKGIRLAQDNELKAILTPDQQTKLAKAHSDMDGDHGGAAKGKGDWKNKQRGQNSRMTQPSSN